MSSRTLQEVQREYLTHAQQLGDCEFRLKTIPGEIDNLHRKMTKLMSEAKDINEKEMLFQKKLNEKKAKEEEDKLKETQDAKVS